MATEKGLEQIKAITESPKENRTVELSTQKIERSFEGFQPGSRANQEGKSTAELSSNPIPVANTGYSDPQLEIRRKQIEDIMSGNLVEVYKAMSTDKQMQFKAAGEKTARDINQLLGETRVKVKKIINLIKDWLKLIPGVNKFFLEKEAKIKTDAIIQLTKGGEQ